MAIVGRSSYPAGSAITDVSGGGDTASSYLQALLSREGAMMNQNQRRRPAAPQRAQASMGANTPPPARAMAGPKGPSDFEKMAERDAIMQMQARQQPAPMRMVHGAGITPGYVQDVNAMNAYQREAYLPQGSSRQFGPAEIGAAESSATSEAAWQAMMEAQRAGSQTTNLQPRPRLSPEQLAAQQRLNQSYGR